MLTPAAIILFTTIRELSLNSGKCWATTRVLAKITGHCAKTIKEAREELVREGFIEKTVRRQGMKTIIKCFPTMYSENMFSEMIAKGAQEIMDEIKESEKKQVDFSCLEDIDEN